MNNIHYKNKSFLDKKIKKISYEGLFSLHVVSDFDRTLTKCFINDKKIPSVISLIRSGGYLTKDYPKKAFELFDKYYPIEIDNTLSIEYKSKKMKEWWQTHEKLLVKLKMNKKVIDDILLRYPKIFRDGAIEFFNFLKSNNIPLLIFSAGVGNLIEGYLKGINAFTQNVHILSNIFNFDKEGYATGYKNEIIHVFNKSETKIKNKEYKKLVSKRKNVILLGDSIGDVSMANETETNTIIKIGFLNEKINQNIVLYKQNFDVVITNDSSMRFVNTLFKNISINT